MRLRLLAVAGCFAMTCSSALAADARLDPALKAIAAIGTDPGKLMTFCEMSATMAAADNEKDQSKNDAADKKVEDLMKSLGPDFTTAWSLGEELDPDKPDGKALGDAMDALDSKCPK